MPVLEVIVHEARQLRTAARGVYVSGSPAGFVSVFYLQTGP